MGKQQIDLQGAMPLTQKLQESMERLLAFMKGGKEGAEDFKVEKAVALIDKCGNLTPIMSSLATSTADEHVKARSALEQVKAEIFTFLSENEWSGCIDVAALLGNAFPSGSDIKLILRDSDLAHTKFAIVERRVKRGSWNIRKNIIFIMNCQSHCHIEKRFERSHHKMQRARSSIKHFWVKNPECKMIVPS